MRHQFDVIDRGEGHIHRYTPTCSCGWKSRHRRSVDEAKKNWNNHIEEAPKGHGRARPLTPAAELPEMLR